MAEAGNTEYDVFISYSHADEALAVALQRGLQRLGKAWYRRRPHMQVLRDQTSLAASSELGDAIKGALDRSGHLLVVLSPRSAGSEWVDEELAYWLETKGKKDIIFVADMGGDGTGSSEVRSVADIDWSGSDVPESARGRFSEPLVVDLTWARRPEELTLRNEDFEDSIATIAAAVRDVPKEELVGEVKAMHTRARIISGALAVGFAILAGAGGIAAAAAVSANALADQAEQRRSEAEASLEQAQDARSVVERDLANARGDLDEARALVDEAEAAAAGFEADAENARIEAENARIDAAAAVELRDEAERARIAAEEATDEALLLRDEARAQAAAATEDAVLQNALADVRRLAAASSELADSDPQLASLLAVEAVALSESLSGGSSSDGADIGSARRVSHAAALGLARDSSLLSTFWPNGLYLVPPEGVVPAYTTGLAFSGDSAVLASIGGAGGYDINVWSISEKRNLLTIDDYYPGSIDVALNGDGSRVAVVSRQFVTVWDVVTGARLGDRFIDTPGTAVWFSPAGDEVATLHEDGRLRYWGLTDSGPTRVEPLGGDVLATARNAIAALDRDGAVLVRQVWGDVTWRGPVIDVVGLSDDGSFVVGRSPSGALILTGAGMSPPLPLSGLEDVHHAAVAAGGIPIAYAGDSDAEGLTVDVFRPVSIQSGVSSRPLMQQGSQVRAGALAISPDGAYLATASKSGLIHLWDASGNDPMHDVLGTTESKITSLQYHPSGAFIATGLEDGTILLWDTESRAQQPDFLAQLSSSVVALAFSHDGASLASGTEDGEILIWAWDEQGEPSVLAGPAPPWPPCSNSLFFDCLASLEFSPGGSMLISGSLGPERGVVVWDLDRSTPVGTRLNDHVLARFAADDGVIVTVDDGYDPDVSIWRRGTSGFVAVGSHTFTDVIHAVSVDPDGELLAFAGGDVVGSNDLGVHFWDLDSDTRTDRAVGPQGFGLDFSLDGSLLAMQGRKGLIHLWEPESREPLNVPVGEDVGPQIDFSPIALTLATHRNLGPFEQQDAVSLWDLDPDHWVETLCSRVNRSLTQGEWAEYLGGRSYAPVCEGQGLVPSIEP